MSLFIIILNGEKIVGCHLPNGEIQANEVLLDIPDVTLADDLAYTDEEFMAVGEYLSDKKVVSGAFVFSQEMVDECALSVAIPFVDEELSLSDIQLNYHADSDSRAVSTAAAWRVYRKELRNYITDGVVVGSQPVRPT